MLRNPREEFGQALLALAKEDERVWALDADLSTSTMSTYIEKNIPDRFVEAGIAEANMVGIGAGLALSGKIPFCNSFAIFMTGRTYDQIRQSLCIPKLSVKICGSSAGLSDYGDGSTHQTIEDIALMRVLPNMVVVSPGDGRQTAEAVRAIAAYDGPAYLRVTRSEMPDLPGDEPFVIGKVYPVVDGNDLTIFATGIMVSRALDAAEILRSEGINICVVNVPSIKPLDVSAIQALAAKTGKVLTCEEHSVIGGLGSAIAEALRKSGIKMDIMGIEDMFGQSANCEADLTEYYKLRPCDIADRIRTALKEL